MGKTIYYCAATLDGFIARSDDSIDWLLGYDGKFEAEDVDPGPMSSGGSYDRFYANVGALVSGSATYEFVLEHIRGGGSWPYVGKPYWVLSSRELGKPAGSEDELRVVNASVRELAPELDAAAGERDVWIVGGGGVASDFADAGLLDEIHVTVVPVVLGEGKPLLERELPGGSLQLLGTTAYGNGMVELRYSVSR